MIGLDFNNPVLKEEMKQWPFKVECGRNGRPMVKVQYEGKTETYYPEEISAI